MFPKIPDARTYDKTPQFQWVRLKNTGAQAIPPWSICEVTSPTLDLAGPDSPPFEGGMTFNARQPTSYLAYQLASSGPFAIQPGDYGPGLHGSILATNESAAADVRAMPTKNSFGLYIGKGGPLVSTGQMAQGVTLWHYDPAGMDGYFLCASATAAATPPGENESCDATTLVAGTGALLVTDGGSFVELPETVSFYNVLAVAIADGTVVFVHRSANGEFHTVGLGKKNCPPFLGTADDDIAAGGTGTVTKQPCGDGSPASESVPDVKNRGGDPIGKNCRVLVIPCNDECDYEAISLGCPDDCDYTGSVYTVGSLFAGLTEGGVELNWQYQTERYRRGKLCSIETGPVLTTTIPTWYCCYPPVCDDIYYKEVDCNTMYVAFYDPNEPTLPDPAVSTYLGTADINVGDGVVHGAKAYGFCDYPTGEPLHFESGPDAYCAIRRASAVISIGNETWIDNILDIACCPDTLEGEYTVGVIDTVCDFDGSEAPPKKIIAKCHVTNPGTPWTSNFPSRARRTTARDPNCCEGVDDPDPCCCPDEFDAGVYFSAKSTHTHNDGTQELTKEFFIPYDLIDSSFGVGSISGTRPSFEQFTVPVWVEKNGELVQATLEVEIDLRCENGVWSGEVNIPKTWDAVLCKPGASEEYTLSNDLCCFQQLDIPPTAILEGVDPGYDKGNPYAAPNNSLEIAIGCPVNLSCQYDDVCDRIYTAALRHPSGGGKYGCCCPPCACPGGDIGDITIGGEALTLYCNECVTKPTYSGSVDIDIVFENINNPAITVTQTYRFTANYHCEQGVWTGGISVTNLNDDAGGDCDVTHQVYTTNNECSLLSEEKNGALDSSIIPAESLLAELRNEFRSFYTTDDLPVSFAGITATGACVGAPQWKYCDTEETMDFEAPIGKWKYAGYSSQKDAHVYAVCMERHHATCEDVAATWFEGETVGSFENLGVHRLPVDYWKLDNESPYIQNLIDTCCGCDPWSESGAIAGTGSTEMCCPEDTDDFPVAIVWGTPTEPLSRMRLMHFGDSVTMAVPITVVSNTLTLDENRTNREEDSGAQQIRDVWVKLTIEPTCEGGQASVDVYIAEYDDCCTANQLSSMRFLGSFPVPISGHTLTIPKEIVRKGISCAWRQDMFPCCDPADWELTTGIQLQFKHYGSEAICTRPDCDKVFTAALVPDALTGTLIHAATGCCCNSGAKSFSRNYKNNLATANWEVPVPFFDMREPLPIAPPNHPIDIATLSEVDIRPCPDGLAIANGGAPGQAESSMISMTINSGNAPCGAGEEFRVSVGQEVDSCDTHDFKIEANTIHHLSSREASRFLLFIGSETGDAQAESCVHSMNAEYKITHTMQDNCVSCGDVQTYVEDNHPDSPWKFYGPSGLKGGCVHVACCCDKDVDGSIVCVPPELPPPPPGWAWTAAVQLPLEWWGLENDEPFIGPGGFKQSECCGCKCVCQEYVDRWNAGGNLTITMLDGPGATSGVMAPVQPTGTNCIAFEVQLLIPLNQPYTGPEYYLRLECGCDQGLTVTPLFQDDDTSPCKDVNLTITSINCPSVEFEVTLADSETGGCPYVGEKRRLRISL